MILLAGALLAAGFAGTPAPGAPATAAPAPVAPAPVAAPPVAPAGEELSHGRFQHVLIYSPPAAPTSVVLMLSGDAGLTPASAEAAREFARHGALVAAIDLPKFAANLDADASDCVFPDGDLENLSHYVQAYYHLTTYHPPFLVGFGAGAAVAYATLVQSPANTFAGALTRGFCPVSSLRKSLCKGSGIEFTRPPQHAGVEFLPAKQIENPWVDLAEAGTACAGTIPVDRFIAQVRGAAAVTLPSPMHGSSPLLAAFDSLAGHAARRLAPAPPAALGTLPVIELPAQAPSAAFDGFALIMSGDGGWAGLDKDVAGALVAHGIPVVGLDSLRYFWNARTPAGLAADTDTLIRYYLAQWHKQRVLLIGYSQGADVLPFALNRLSAATREHVALAVLIGMSEHALFEFHVTSWLSDDKSGPLTLPEVQRINGMPVLCIYGKDESDSLCPQLAHGTTRVVELPGGHHFNGDYAGLAREILASAAPVAPGGAPGVPGAH
jgi:type IV secretory pathway VirJ component